MMQRITGTVILHTSAHGPCRCGDGPHIFRHYLALEPYGSPFPAHVWKDVDHGLHAVLHCKHFEGKTMAITARVVA
jgi:hypothetical protein